MNLTPEINKEEILKSAESCAHCGLCYQTLPSLTKSYQHSDTCPAGLYFNFDAYYSPGRNEIAKSILQGRYDPKDSKNYLKSYILAQHVVLVKLIAGMVMM